MSFVWEESVPADAVLPASAGLGSRGVSGNGRAVPSWPEAGAMLDAVRRIADGPLAAQAEAIDREGVYPEAILRELGAAGAFRAQLGGADGQPDYASAINAIAEVSRVCASTGFMMWCQLACSMYLARSANTALDDGLLARLATGDQLGGTGLSNPMKYLAGIEPLALRASQDGEDVIVEGTLPWVSNLGQDHVFCAMAGVQTPEGMVEMMFVASCADEGIEMRPCPSFSGMEGTGTWGLRFDRYRVKPSQVVACPARPFIAGIRSAFVLLQCGMGWGVTQGAIDSMWAVESQLGHVNAFLEDRPADLQQELDALKARTLALARTPYECSDAFFLDVLDVRAHAAELALRAAQSALMHQGARGYLMRSAVQRRVRESHFVAIVSPALKHIRKEIARLSASRMPS
ncbi:MAG: acyl-CoA dehydrogenase family protein [Lautropia sp.]|nr:acyl-CoA dehydrogenase family protein [Lautropia sp.]